MKNDKSILIFDKTRDKILLLLGGSIEKQIFWCHTFPVETADRISGLGTVEI